MVEPHLSHRVARQFGFIQPIPNSFGLLTPQKHAQLQHMRRGGKPEVDYIEKHQQYVDEWNSRNNRLFQGVQGTTTAEGYMQWYMERTVLFVSRPDVQAAGRYPPWDAGQQLAVIRYIFVY